MSPGWSWLWAAKPSCTMPTRRQGHGQQHLERRRRSLVGFCCRWCVTYKKGQSIGRNGCFGRIHPDIIQPTVVTRPEPHNLQVRHAVLVCGAIQLVWLAACFDARCACHCLQWTAAHSCSWPP